jgi:hypothetical protein
LTNFAIDIKSGDDRKEQRITLVIPPVDKITPASSNKETKVASELNKYPEEFLKAMGII